MWGHFANVLKQQARPPAEFLSSLHSRYTEKITVYVFFLKDYEKKSKQVQRYFRDCQNLKEIASTII